MIGLEEIQHGFEELELGIAQIENAVEMLEMMEDLGISSSKIDEFMSKLENLCKEVTVIIPSVKKSIKDEISSFEL